jgi:hypothetical protein
MTEQIDVKTIQVVVPLQHLGQIVAAYLVDVGAVAEANTVYSVNIPVTTDDENNVTISVGIIEGILN